MSPFQNWVVSNALTRGLVIMWHCAPFGPVKFVRWFIRWKALPKLVTDLCLAYEDRFDAGYLFAPCMVEVYGYEQARRVAFAEVEIESDKVIGYPFDAGVLMWFIHHAREVF